VEEVKEAKKTASPNWRVKKNAPKPKKRASKQNSKGKSKK
jgi:hypothetical protein